MLRRRWFFTFHFRSVCPWESERSWACLTKTSPSHLPPTSCWICGLDCKLSEVSLAHVCVLRSAPFPKHSREGQKLAVRVSEAGAKGPHMKALPVRGGDKGGQINNWSWVNSTSSGSHVWVFPKIESKSEESAICPERRCCSNVRLHHRRRLGGVPKHRKSRDLRIGTHSTEIFLNLYF